MAVCQREGVQSIALLLYLLGLLLFVSLFLQGPHLFFLLSVFFSGAPFRPLKVPESAEI